MQFILQMRLHRLACGRMADDFVVSYWDNNHLGPATFEPTFSTCVLMKMAAHKLEERIEDASPDRELYRNCNYYCIIVSSSDLILLTLSWKIMCSF